MVVPAVKRSWPGCVPVIVQFSTQQRFPCQVFHPLMDDITPASTAADSNTA